MIVNRRRYGAIDPAVGVEFNSDGTAIMPAQDYGVTNSPPSQVKSAGSSTDWGSLLGNVLGTAGSLFVRNFSPSQGLQTTNNLTPPRAPEPVKVVQEFPISTPVMVAGGLAILGLGAFVLLRKPRGA